MGSVGFDPSKLNKLRDDWMTKYTQTQNLVTQLNPNRFQSTDSSDPMSKNGSIFKAEGTNGANAAQNSSSTINNNQNTVADSTDQQIPTGQNTVVTGSGTTQLASSLKDPQPGDNQGEQNDFTQKKNEADQKMREAKDKYFSYLSVALSFDPGAANSVFGTEGTGEPQGNTAVGDSAQNEEIAQTTDNYTGNADVNAEDASDPSKTDTAYQQPDAEQEDQSVNQQIMKAIQLAQQDAMKQHALEVDYAKILESNTESMV